MYTEIVFVYILAALASQWTTIFCDIPRDIVMEKFEGGICVRGNEDPLIFPTSYLECLEECRIRSKCVAISHLPAMQVCRIHKDPVGVTVPCRNYVYAEKRRWTEKVKDGCESTNCADNQICVLSGDAATCVNSECPRIRTIVNGAVNGNEVRKGKRVSFLCDKGYGLVGSNTLTCLGNAEWSGETPVCSDDSPSPSSPVDETDNITTDPPGETDDPTTDTAGETVDPIIDPVDETVDPIIDPVDETVDPIIDPADETVDPTTDPLDETDDPNTETDDPNTDPAGETVDPTTDPLDETDDPNTETDDPNTDAAGETDGPIIDPPSETDNPTTDAPGMTDSSTTDAAGVTDSTDKTDNPDPPPIILPPCDNATPCPDRMECMEGQCVCIFGFKYNPDKGKCTNWCKVYTNTFQKHVDKSFEDISNIKESDISHIQIVKESECLKECDKHDLCRFVTVTTNTDQITCRVYKSFHDVDSTAITTSGTTTYIRDCALVAPYATACVVSGPGPRSRLVGDFECRGGICGCVFGRVYDPTSVTCVQSCALYSDNFEEHAGSYTNLMLPTDAFRESHDTVLSCREKCTGREKCTILSVKENDDNGYLCIFANMDSVRNTMSVENLTGATTFLRNCKGNTDNNVETTTPATTTPMETTTSATTTPVETTTQVETTTPVETTAPVETTTPATTTPSSSREEEVSYNNACDPTSVTKCSALMECRQGFCKCVFGRVYKMESNTCVQPSECLHRYGSTFQKHYNVGVRSDAVPGQQLGYETTGDCEHTCTDTQGCNLVYKMTFNGVTVCQLFSAVDVSTLVTIPSTDRAISLRDCRPTEKFN